MSSRIWTKINTNRVNDLINNILIVVLINIICPSQMFLSLMVYFITDAISLSQLCSVSHTLSLSRSLRCLALFPVCPVWYKIPGNFFQLIIVRNKVVRDTSSFYLGFAHNNTHVTMRLCQPPDGSTSPKYKLLCFITSKKICKEKNALAFNQDRCCHLVLCLQLIPFHCKWRL
jgi:hypothetical protein